MKNKKTNNQKYAGLNNLVKRPGGVKNDSQASYANPNDIMAMALQDIYGINRDKNKLDIFMRELTSLLSELATNGKEKTLLGSDMNEFFMLYVNTLNLCGRMKEVLDENGIDFDINGNEEK